MLRPNNVQLRNYSLTNQQNVVDRVVIQGRPMLSCSHPSSTESQFTCSTAGRSAQNALIIVASFGSSLSCAFNYYSMETSVSRMSRETASSML